MTAIAAAGRAPWWPLALARTRALLPQQSDWTAATRGKRRNLVAGATVAVIALPLALAFGETSGLGARAGIVTAIVAGGVAAIFGGSNLQVSGPTGAMTVVLVPIVHRFGEAGVLMVGLMAGAILIGIAAARFGRFVQFIPVPVVEGFTAGIAVVIALQQAPAILGVTPSGADKSWQTALDAVRDYVQAPDFAPVAMSLGVATVILLGARWRPSLPLSLLAVAGAMAANHLGHLGLASLGPIPSGLPRPSLAFVDLGAIWPLATAAVAVAALAALESLLSATVADGMTVNERHDPDRELFGQGLANVAAPIFGGIPATAAIARTAVNVRAGASSKLASLVHAIVLLAIVAVAARWVSEIPLAALAGVLLATTVRMVEVGSLRNLARSSRQDAMILVVTLVLTVVADLVAAVALGIAVAIVLALRSVADSARLEAMPLETGVDHSEEEHALLHEHVVAYRLDGPLFFAAAHRFLLELSEVAVVRVVILRMSRVSAIDATGARVLGDAIERLERRGVVVLLSGIRPGHDRVLANLGVAAHLRAEGMVFPDTPSAIEKAYAILGRSDGHGHERSDT